MDIKDALAIVEKRLLDQVSSKQPSQRQAEADMIRAGMTIVRHGVDLLQRLVDTSEERTKSMAKLAALAEKQDGY